jgi:hypothetical protein
MQTKIDPFSFTLRKIFSIRRGKQFDLSQRMLFFRAMTDVMVASI